MSSSKKTGGDAQPKSDQPYKVGNKKPPREHMFKEGQSGNPSGRPKGRAPFRNILLKEFYRRVSVMIDGASGKLGNDELFAKHLVRSGLTKGPRAAEMLLNHVLTSEEQRAAEAAAAAAKKRMEPEKPFSWTDEQDKILEELEMALKSSDGIDAEHNNKGDGQSEGPPPG